ncbi:MAG: hypothetical protein IKF14_01580 [Atopobiaceae bacterium]|nr:hypothetical protein [Atopobiaceae bacterium]
MDVYQLQRTLNQQNAMATQYEQQAAEFDSMANSAQGTLNFINDQLSRARNAKAACDRVVAQQKEDCNDFRQYAQKIDSALGVTKEFSSVADSITADDEGYASSAAKAALELVQSLEQRSSSLSAQISSYRNQAATQRSKASSARNAAYRTRIAIDQAYRQ